MTCRAVGVHPPLQLSHYQVKFAATALYDMSVAALYVINAHVSMNSLTHSVPRIGSEDACPVGPTSFQFLLPPDSPITISPSVGTVLPGKVGVGRWGGGPGTTAWLGPPDAAGMGSALPSCIPGRSGASVASELSQGEASPARQGHHAVPGHGAGLGQCSQGGTEAWSPGAQESVCPLGWSRVPPTPLFPVKQRARPQDLRDRGGLWRGLREGHVGGGGAGPPWFQ